MLLRALEEKRFLPLGADTEVASDFQLIAGTNRDLGASVRSGAFRDDLLARINLWTFDLPPLRDRREDIEPNIDYELDRFAQQHSRLVRFSAEARAHFLRFATAPDTAWAGNFRDLSAAVTRMATLAPGGRITQEIVREEIDRLKTAWASRSVDEHAGLQALLGPHAMDDIDLFERAQLAQVIATCRSSQSLADAGRKLFAASRRRRASTNDSDRLRKYLDRYGLDWSSIATGRSARD